MKEKGLVFLLFVFSLLTNNIVAQSSPQTNEEKACFPMWVFTDDLYIGVSDPFVSEEKARQQAVERALFFYAIKNNGISVLENSELYEKLRDDIRYENINKLVRTLLFSVKLKSLQYEIAKEWWSDNGELFVDLNVGEGENVSGSYEFTAVLKKDIYEDAIPSKMKKNMHFLLQIKDSKNENSASFWEKNNDEINCIWRDSVLTYSDKYLFYGKNCEGGSVLNSFVLKYSFWTSLFESFGEGLFAYAMKNLKVASLHTVYGSRFEKLTSIDVIDVLKCDWRKRGVKDSKLLLDWIISEN